MSRTKLALVITAAALALPASASAATKIFAGSAGGTGKIAMDVKVNRYGIPKMITEIRGADLPSQCEQSGPLTTNTTTPPIQIRVNNRYRFYGELVQPTYGNVSWIRGRFNSKRQVSGTFVFDYHFQADSNYPEENCTTGELPFTATKGAPDVVPPTSTR